MLEQSEFGLTSLLEKCQVGWTNMLEQRQFGQTSLLEKHQIGQTTILEQSQINGQMHMGPPTNWKGLPPVDAEIYVRNLPNDVHAMELYQLFGCIGDIYEIRVPVRWGGENKGYAFIRFVNSEMAITAIRNLHLYEIRRNRKIHIEKSWDNCRLFLSAVPTDKSGAELMEDLSEYVEGITQVLAYTDPANRRRYRGYAFVQFKSHRSAAVAKRTLTRDLCCQLFGTMCGVAWANSQPPQEYRPFKKSPPEELYSIPPVEYRPVKKSSPEELYSIPPVEYRPVQQSPPEELYSIPSVEYWPFKKSPTEELYSIPPVEYRSVKKSPPEELYSIPPVEYRSVKQSPPEELYSNPPVKKCSLEEQFPHLSLEYRSVRKGSLEMEHPEWFRFDKQSLPTRQADVGPTFT